MNISKWLPKQNNDIIKIFEQNRQLERSFRILGKKFATDINLDLPDYYEFERLLQQCKQCFELSLLIQCKLTRIGSSSADKNIERSPYKVLLNKKSLLIRQSLKKRHFQLIFIVNKIVKFMLGLTCSTDTESEMVTDAALLLATLHNESVNALLQNVKSSSGARVCSNTFPSLMTNPKRIDVSTILQTISKQRAEHCCLALISCLLATCKTEMSHNNESESSSVEVLRALTSHLTPTLDKEQEGLEAMAAHEMQMIERNDKIIHPQILSETDINDPVIKFFDNMAAQQPTNVKTTTPVTYLMNEPDSNDLLEDLITDEEIFIANILMKVVKLCPTAFDHPKMNKEEIVKWMNRGTRGLWTQVGGTLEHVVLWWSNNSLACRATVCAKYLRDWLLLIQPDDAPEPILSTLKGLGETLTPHVAGTTWDRQFRLALVASLLPVDHSYENTEFHCVNTNILGTIPGRLWSELLYTLVSFCNSCDRMGTIANELPIVEQIPVLHRLDHSVHTMRLWAAGITKIMCSDWNMLMFFRVIHNDISLCLEQLNELRVPELVSAGPLEVHVQVCVALRAKLVSEIKINIQKLKLTCTQCIDVLASICKTTCLATLSLCFPSPRSWQSELLQSQANEYVTYYLEQIYQPVLEATKDLEILNLILKILCEAWLDHIYLKKFKFSYCGAVNLLKDFDGVAAWIRESTALQEEEHREILAKHEVLRMCEGVGRILLRKPDEVISMLPSPKYLKRSSEEEEDEEKAPLPPEMFVPNQQRWLELRARNRRGLNMLCLCSGIEVFN